MLKGNTIKMELDKKSNTNPITNCHRYGLTNVKISRDLARLFLENFGRSACSFSIWAQS